MDEARRTALAKKVKGIGAAAIGTGVGSGLAIVGGGMAHGDAGFALIMAGIVGLGSCLGLSQTYAVLRDLFESDKH